jgi:hypothetical protein
MVEPVASPSSTRITVRPRTFGGGLDRGRPQVDLGEDLVVEDPDAAARDRAHGQLLVPRHAELADQEDVERRLERAGDLVADRDASARERQDDDARPVGVGAEHAGQRAAGVGSVAEPALHR